MYFVNKLINLGVNQGSRMPALPDIFAALGEPTRFAIVERLLREGALSAGELQRDCAISPPAVSSHLRVLHDAGLVERRIEKQRRIYSARPAAVEGVAAWAMSHREFWQVSLARLERALTEEMSRR
jgi:DNA-binding transcriptional ArsR family regulator